MLEWFRFQFAWQFSQMRLVIAVVFLAASVGLNVCGPQLQKGGDVDVYWGWPLPSAEGIYGPSLGAYLTPEQMDQFVRFDRLPWTHQAYRFSFRWRWLNNWEWPVDNSSFDRRVSIFVIPAIINVLFPLTVLALILFLQIPRRKVAANVE